MQADGAPLGVCIKNSEGRAGLNGTFTDDGPQSMLEDADIKKLDMISAFSAAFLDLICGGSESCPLRYLFQNMWMLLISYVLINEEKNGRQKLFWNYDDIYRGFKRPWS